MDSRLLKFNGTAIFIPYVGYFCSKLCDWVPRLEEILIVYAVKHKKLDKANTRLELFLEF